MPVRRISRFGASSRRAGYLGKLGHGCIGCSKEGFWDNGPFYQHLPKFPGFGIESTAYTIGTVVGVAKLAGVAAHAVTTNVRKRKVIAEVHTENQKESQSPMARIVFDPATLTLD